MAQSKIMSLNDLLIAYKPMVLMVAMQNVTFTSQLGILYAHTQIDMLETYVTSCDILEIHL